MKGYFELIVKPEFIHLSIVGAIILYFGLLKIFTGNKFEVYKTNRKISNVTSIASLSYLTIYWIPVFVNWIKEFENFNNTFNVGFILFSTLLFSSVLSIIEFYVNIENPNSHLRNSERNIEIEKESKQLSSQNIKEYTSTIKSCEKVLKQVRPLTFEYVGFNGNNDSSIPIELEKGRYQYKISNTNAILIFYLREIVTRSGTKYLKPENSIKAGAVAYSFEDLFSTIKDFPIQDPAIDENVVHQFISKLYSDKLEELNFERKIKNENSTIPLGDFLFNNSVLLLSIGNSILFPNSRKAKLIRIILGLIKFFALGILIMIFLK